MATSNCNQNCGCNNSYTVTAPCPPSCTEVFNAQCIVYTGTDLVCGDDTVINRYDYMDTVVTKMINYFCSKLDAEERWFELIDFATTSITPTSGTASLSLLADPATVGAGGSGVSAVLSGTGTSAQYDLLNTDPGTAQLIFGTVDCNNDGGPSVGTAVAASNTDTLTLVGGTEVSLSVPSPNTVVIDCDITSIYSNVAGDTGNVAAGTVTDSLEIVGAADSAITTAISGVPGVATLEIDWAGVTVGAGLTGTGLSGDPLINTANIFSDITGDAGPGLTASGLTDSVYISGGKGIATDSGTNPGIVEIVADVAKYTSPATAIGASATVNFTHNLNTLNVTVSVIDLILPLPHTMFTQGIDYSVQMVNANEISITDLTGAGLPNAGVTVIG